MSHRLKYGGGGETGNGDVTQLVAIDNGVQRSNAVTSFRDGSCNTTVNLHSRSRCYDICVNACRRRRLVAGVCRIARAVIASGEREREREFGDARKRMEVWGVSRVRMVHPRGVCVHWDHATLWRATRRTLPPAHTHPGSCT